MHFLTVFFSILEKQNKKKKKKTHEARSGLKGGCDDALTFQTSNIVLQFRFCRLANGHVTFLFLIVLIEAIRHALTL